MGAPPSSFSLDSATDGLGGTYRIAPSVTPPRYEQEPQGPYYIQQSGAVYFVFQRATNTEAFTLAPSLGLQDTYDILATCTPPARCASVGIAYPNLELGANWNWDVNLSTAAQTCTVPQDVQGSARLSGKQDKCPATLNLGQLCEYACPNGYNATVSCMQSGLRYDIGKSAKGPAGNVTLKEYTDLLSQCPQGPAGSAPASCIIPDFIRNGATYRDETEKCRESLESGSFCRYTTCPNGDKPNDITYISCNNGKLSYFAGGVPSDTFSSKCPTTTIAQGAGGAGGAADPALTTGQTAAGPTVSNRPCEVPTDVKLVPRTKVEPPNAHGACHLANTAGTPSAPIAQRDRRTSRSFRVMTAL